MTSWRNDNNDNDNLKRGIVDDNRLIITLYQARKTRTMPRVISRITALSLRRIAHIYLRARK